ncbi:MAG: hypothetical protein R3F56_23455 [Planctomycetota bacterium]
MLPGTELEVWRRGSEVFRRHIEPDPDLGYGPILGTDAYDQYGTLRNDYQLEKTKGVVRLLFIGDSVTSRGKIVAALRERCGEGFEYWNAGVEGYNTRQEVAWYLRHNWRIRPDHVILTLHPNDFSAGLVAVDDEEGKLAMFATGNRFDLSSPWLFRHSEIYRRYVLARASLMSPYTVEDGIADVRKALERLRDRLRTDDVGLSIVVLPTIRPPTEWTDSDRRVHTAALGVVSELSVRAFDLLPALNRAVADHLPLGEIPGDTWHPSRELAGVMAEHLIAAKLLH